LSVGIKDVGFIVLCMNAKQNKINMYFTADVEQENSNYKFNQKKRKVVIK